MKKLNILFASLGILTLVLLGIFLINQFNKKNESDDTKYPSEGTIPTEFTLIESRVSELEKECISNNQLNPECIATATKDISLCENIELEANRVDCLVYVTGDASYCYQHQDENEKNQCLGSMLGNTSYCEKITFNDFKYGCMAVATWDSKYCKEIEYEVDKYKCLASIESNPEYCNEIKDLQEASDCRAEMENDPEKCKESQEVYCRSWAIQTIALEDNKSSYCQYIDAIESINRCYRSFNLTNPELDDS